MGHLVIRQEGQGHQQPHHGGPGAILGIQHIRIMVELDGLDHGFGQLPVVPQHGPHHHVIGAMGLVFHLGQRPGGLVSLGQGLAVFGETLHQQGNAAIVEKPIGVGVFRRHGRQAPGQPGAGHGVEIGAFPEPVHIEAGRGQGFLQGKAGHHAEDVFQPQHRRGLLHTAHLLAQTEIGGIGGLHHGCGQPHVPADETADFDEIHLVLSGFREQGHEHTGTRGNGNGFEQVGHLAGPDFFHGMFLKHGGKPPTVGPVPLGDGSGHEISACSSF